MRRSAWRPSRNCRSPAEPRFGQARSPAGDGAKRSGLTGPRTAGQSRVVMATVHATLAHVSELARRSRRAGGRKAGGGDQRPPQSEIQSECALTYMNASSGQNLSGALMANENVTRARVEHARRTRRCHGQGAASPDERDMHLGRERPPKTGPGTVIGGWQRGSLTPQMPPSLLLTAAPTATRAAKSAARCDSQVVQCSHIDGS